MWQKVWAKVKEWGLVLAAIVGLLLWARNPDGLGKGT